MVFVERFFEGNRCRRGDYRDVAIVFQLSGEPLQQSGIDQRLVTLDVENDGCFLELSGHFRNPVSAARMIRSSHGDFRAEIKSYFGDSHVIGSNHDLVEAICLAATLPDVSNQRFAGDTVECFSRESGGSPSGRDDADNFADWHDASFLGGSLGISLPG